MSSYKSSFLNEAVARGFFYQSTNLEAIDEYLSTPGRSGYVGFDATADSLHVGGFIPIGLMRLFQKHGHRPIILVGGGTTKVGDPSFRNTTRPILTDEQIADNISGIKKCLTPFLRFGDGPSDAKMVNNADWLDELAYLPFLREVGKFFSVNRMISFDSVKTKLDANNSLSFLEFNYMVMQGYDFMHLFKNEGCRIQFGGQDQWGNICCGVDLIKKKLGEEVFGFTNPLLLTSDGKKMGKTANGAVWLRSDRLSAYDFWQYWRNVNDADVIKLMYLFTDLDLAEIRRMEDVVKGADCSGINDLKVILADEITGLVHGKGSLADIHNSAFKMFAKDLSAADLSSVSGIPRYTLSDFKKSVVDVLVESGLCCSRGDAKRLIRGGGVYVDDEPIDEEYSFKIEAFKDGLLKLSCGQKRHILVELKI